MSYIRSPLFNGWYPGEVVGRQMWNGWYTPMTTAQYAVYVAQQSGEPDNTSADFLPYTFTDDTPATFYYPWLVNTHYWVGVSQINACGKESATISWFHILTDASGFPSIVFPQAVTGLHIRTIADGDISIAWHYILATGANDPDKFVVWEYDWRGNNVNTQDVSFVSGTKRYSLNYTPNSPSGWLAVRSVIGTTYNEHVNYVRFVADAVAPSATLQAEVV